MYAIVDIETTGGKPDVNGITEIAIFIFDGEKIIDIFCTLVNPLKPIPAFIESYTGITNTMVKSAPTFEEISEKVFTLLQPHIFVAHSVNYDYTFIKEQLAANNFALHTKKVCTVRLSRKIFPGKKSYSLGNLCASLNIPINNRHRAFGDALATVEVFKKILQHQNAIVVIEQFIKHGSGEYYLPPHLNKQEFDSLPHGFGVYYFYNHQGKIIYIGKAKNIKKRVYTHFTAKPEIKNKVNFISEIAHIGYNSTPTELHAFILESIEIKKHFPTYNKAQKSISFDVGIYDYEDQNGYIHLAIDKTRKHATPLKKFKTHSHALNCMQSLIIEFNLCAKLCGFAVQDKMCDANKNGTCNGACIGIESSFVYNKKAQQAVDELLKSESFVIIEQAERKGNMACVLVENGLFWGMGTVPNDFQITHIHNLKNMLKPFQGNFYINNLIESAKKKNATIIYF